MAYTGYEADLAEFNDLFMKDFKYSPKGVNKMGCGLDECINFSINISRKNYLDYFPEKPFPKDVKMVGNTIKSKKMPAYISKFLETGVRKLLQNKGKEFLDEYYSYIEKIYNYQIPLKDIASKGKVKKSIKDYKEDCKTITKAGRPKSRQAWMELAIKENLNVNMGETIYYINTGKTKSQSDCKKVKKYYRMSDGEKMYCTAEIEKAYKKYTKEYPLSNVSEKEYVEIYFPDVAKEEEIVLNCQLLPIEIVESESDIIIDTPIKYNVPKYIAQFNSRITPLLVCFSPEIRSQIIVTTPADRKFFTNEEAKLVSGIPNKPEDQDTYEQLMTMEDKEIKFWLSHPEWEVPFLKECGMDWEQIKSGYLDRMEREKALGVDLVREQFNKALSELTEDNVNAFIEGTVPKSLAKIANYDPSTGNFYDKNHPDMKIGSSNDIFELNEFLESPSTAENEEELDS